MGFVARNPKILVLCPEAAMDSYLHYRYALDRIEAWQKQAEIYRLVGQQPNFQVKLSKLFYALAKRLEPKTEARPDIRL
jgi:hypothetical protein